MRAFSHRLPATAATFCALLLAAACGGGSSTSAPSSSSGAPVDGGTLLAGIPASPDHLDAAFSATTESWEILEATNDGLMTFERTSGGAGSQVVPDLAAAPPTITDGGLVYSFHLRPGVRFSPPVDRAVRPSDVKWSIERILRMNTSNVSWYVGIVGAAAYQAGHSAAISGIVADDQAMTNSFHLTQPDGAFLDYLAEPPAFVYPAGTPFHDISTNSRYRVATGPYMISSYTPNQQVLLTKNPNFTPRQNTPGGHLSRIQITIGVTPEQAVNETADGQLDWYFENPPPDRLAQLLARYPSQVHKYPTGEIEYFSMNERLFPFNKLAVRQAVNYAVDRQSMLKLEGGQGVVSENVIPPTFGTAYRPHNFYPHDMAKAKALMASAGVRGAHVTVWVLNTDPYPNVAQYLASVLNQLGLAATVKVVDASVYWDLIANEKTDPQIAYNNWSQDFPEGEDFIDTQLNGQGIVGVGNNNQSNVDIAAYNRMIDRAKRMPLGNPRNAIWAQLDALYTKNNAPWVVFMNAARYKYVSARLRGLVFNGTFYNLFPSMWLAR